MWQRFTERARKSIFYAQEEAGGLGENYVSTEHMILGLIREEDNMACRILGRLNVSPYKIRFEIERQVTRGDGRLGQDMQLTPRAKRVIDLAYDEARQLNNNYIGTEHLLLGLIREKGGLAGRVLAELGVDLHHTRQAVQELQESGEHPHHSSIPAPSVPAYRAVDSTPARGVTELLTELISGQKRIEAKLDEFLKTEEKKRKSRKRKPAEDK